MTSLGLNEQELSFITHILEGPHADMFGSGQQPEVHQVSMILFSLWNEQELSESVALQLVQTLRLYMECLFDSVNRACQYY